MVSVAVRPDDADASISVDCLRISFSQELQLVLYRHWTLYDSLCHTQYTACKFCVWTSNGRRLLREFLACMGSVHSVMNLFHLCILVTIFKLLRPIWLRHCEDLILQINGAISIAAFTQVVQFCDLLKLFKLTP